MKAKITTTIHFEIKDADLFGGYGTTGYSALSFSHIVTEDEPNIFKDSTYAHVKRAVVYMAEKFGVSTDKIRTISENEYNENT